MGRSPPTKPNPDPPRMHIAALLEALEAAGEETDSSTQSSPLSYRSNGHDGLTDIESDSDSIVECALARTAPKMDGRAAKATGTPLDSAKRERERGGGGGCLRSMLLRA